MELAQCNLLLQIIEKLKLNQLWDSDEIVQQWSNTFNIIGEVFYRAGKLILESDIASDPALV